jgi:capsid protein
MIAAPSNNVIVAPNGRPAIDEVFANWYEGSRWSPHRSWVWYPVQDAKRDLDKFTRYELVKHSRYLWKNSPIVRGLIERLVNLVIGCGIHPVPISSDPVWNKKATAAWKTICRRPCVDSRVTMSQYQRIKARQRFGDGEGFSLLSYHVRSGKDGIAGLEADRVTGGTEISTEGTNTSSNIDGILLDRQGMPTGYQVRGVDKPYAAETVVHHFTPSRDGQVRGEPIMAACINTARDVDDILALEKQAVKEASAHKDIIKTANGELDPETFRKMKFSQAYSTPLSLPADGTAKNDYYKVMFGAEPVVLRKGDEYTPYKPDRPGSAWQGFMAFLANSIVLSTGLPPSLLLPVDAGGTDIRRDLELAQRIIEPWQQDLAAEWQIIWEYFMEGLIEDGPLMNPPADWREVRWHFPKSITVDRGRDAQQDRADVQAGLMSREEYHGRYGDDGDAYEAAIVSEAKRRRLRITGTPEIQPFKDVREFVEFLSLDVALFKSGEPAPESTTPAKSDSPATKPKQKTK